MKKTLELLNSGTAEDRLSALFDTVSSETAQPEGNPDFVNNHIHTFYSFSPYSPTAAVYFARAEGLMTAGLMDHDSIAGAREFIKAGEIAGIATTVGLECRVSVEGTELQGKRINNPDQKGIAYMALHGVPHHQIENLQQVFAPLREKRNIRNRKMTEKINSAVGHCGITIDFDADVLPFSRFGEGGSVTERHLISSVCKKVISIAGAGKTAKFVEEKMKIQLDEKQRKRLADSGNPYLEYDLLAVFKANLVERIYVPATDECIHISELSLLSRKTGAMLCYAYLGDVEDSVTGDKKAQKFEDSYLDVLFYTLESHGVEGVTYMPSRNTAEQLEKLQKMCRERGITEISGEDINSPRQSFVCRQLEQPQFKHLVGATWKLIERERALSK